MKFKNLLAAGVALSFGVGSLQARTWTNADGSKTFEADFKTYDKEGGKVTVLMGNGRSVTFAVAKLSEDDRKFLDEQAKNDPAAGGADVKDALKEQKIGAKLIKPGILKKLDGKRFAKFEMEKAPEYYLVYYSASW